jgi:mRNA interferase MazF
VTDSYVPDVGHIVWITLEPHVGREQSGRRPFLVLSKRSYNDKTSLAVGLPITTSRKGYPFELPLKLGSKTVGVALADQVKSLDWRGRAVDYIEKAKPETLREARALIGVFLQLI